MRITFVFALAFSATFPATYHLTHSAESGGSWSKASMIDYTDQYIKKVRSKFPERVERIRKQTEIQVPLNYQYDITKEPHKTNYENAVSGKTSENRALDYLQRILEDMAEVAEPIFEAEEKAFKAWKKEPKVMGNWTLMKTDKDEYREARVFGAKIEARDLGVVLDISPSMREYLPAVRAEILKSFPDAVVIETKGSFISGRLGDNRWWWAKPSSQINPFSPELYHHPIAIEKAYQAAWNARVDGAAAVLAMVEIGGFDALYWFTDFDDPLDGIATFADRIKDAPTKLYIHSQTGVVPNQLKSALRDNGGAVIEAKVKKTAPKIDIKPEPAPQKPETMPEPETTKTDAPKRVKPVLTKRIEVLKNGRPRRFDAEFFVLDLDKEMGEQFDIKYFEDGAARETILSQMLALAKQNTVKRLERVKVLGEDGTLVSGESGVKKSDVGGAPKLMEGLELEMEPRLNDTGAIDLKLSAWHAHQKQYNDHSPVNRITTRAHVSPGTYFLAGRWKKYPYHRILIGVVNYDGVPKMDLDADLQTFHIDTSLYSARPKYPKKQFSAGTIAIVSEGQETRTEIGWSGVRTVKTPDGRFETRRIFYGYTAIVTPVLNGNSVAAELNLSNVSGAGGGKFNINTLIGEQSLEIGKKKESPMQFSDMPGGTAQEGLWAAHVTCRLPALLDPTEKYMTTRAKMVDEPYLKAMDLVKNQYLTALHRTAQKLGANHPSHRVLKTELNTVIQTGKAPEEKTTDPELAKLRKIYHSLIAREDAKRSANLDQVRSMFPGVTVEN